jgi:hypothetical protein
VTTAWAGAFEAPALRGEFRLTAPWSGPDDRAPFVPALAWSWPCSGVAGAAVVATATAATAAGRRPPRRRGCGGGRPGAHRLTTDPVRARIGRRGVLVRDPVRKAAIWKKIFAPD